jgi:hypothetical protein
MSGSYYSTVPNGYIEPRLSKEGVGAWPAQTVIDVFQSTVDRFGNEPAMCYKTAVNVSSSYFLEYYVILFSFLLG